MAASKKETVNAIDLLTEDHKNVRKMFKDFEKMHEDATPEEKQELVEQICSELILHTSVEEEIFYPAAREAIDDDDLMNEAEVEHASAKDLIEQLQAMDPSDPDTLYAAAYPVRRDGFSGGAHLIYNLPFYLIIFRYW